jgi:signal transduction histidine kinase
MSGLLKTVLKQWERRSRRRFLQPLAIALVSLLLAVLFFTMAMMDLRRLENILADVLKMKASTIVENIEKASRGKFGRLMQAGGGEYRGSLATLPVDEYALSVQESLVRALIDLARTIDYREQAGALSFSDLQKMAATEHFLAVILLDERGRIVFESAQLPRDCFSDGVSLVKGEREVAIQLFGSRHGQDSMGFIGIRRQDGKGAVLLALDAKGRQYWGWKVAVQEAIEELQWVKGFVYLAVEDARGGMLAQTGSLPEEKVEECMLMASSSKEPDSPVSQCVRVGNVKFLELSLPLHLDGKVIGTARVGLETQETDALLVKNRRHAFLWSGLLMGIGLLAMALLYRTQNHHVARLQAMQERLHQTERLSSLGKLGAGVAHEIRNPLNAISMAVQRLQREFAPEEEEKKKSFDRITYIVRDEIRRLNSIVEDFLSLSRSNRMDFRRQSVVELLERVVFLVQEEAGARAVRIEKHWANPAPMARMDAGRMEQALLNIVKNGVESISGGGVVSITCGALSRNVTSISIRDTGAGIPAGKEQEIFDPFYTTKENGVGLGLAIANEIIAAHGGEILVSGEPGKGTTFEILLHHHEKEQ